MSKYLKNRLPDFILALPITIPVSFLALGFIYMVNNVLSKLSGSKLDPSISSLPFPNIASSILWGFLFSIIIAGIFLFIADMLKCDQKHQWARRLSKELRTFLIIFYVFIVTAFVSQLIHFLPFEFLMTHFEVTSGALGWHDIILYITMLLVMSWYTTNQTRHNSSYMLPRFILYTLLSVPFIVILVSVLFLFSNTHVLMPFQLPLIAFVGGVAVLFPVLAYTLPIQK